MKKIVTLCLLIALLALLLPAFSSCDNGDVITLYVYNWGEYISDGTDGSLDVNAAFEAFCAERGLKVKVNYSTYSSNEDMYAKISNGATEYDIVVPSDYMIARMIDEGLLRPLNMENIPNAQYIDYSAIFKEGETPYYDPTMAYSIPYTYGTVGIIYDYTQVDAADVETWGVMWNEKYAGNILQFNNSRDAFATAQFYLGKSVNSKNEADWRLALDMLRKQKPLVQGYVMDEIFNKMENGSALIAPYYAGDFFTMYEDNQNLAFAYPKNEATNVFVDAMCIPTSSQHPEIAELYIDFMLSKEAAIANAEYVCYASPNRQVFEDEDYRATMQELHPDAIKYLYGTEDLNLEFYQFLDEDQQRLLNDLWEELKIESPINTAIIVMAAAIAGGCVGAGVFFTVRRYRRRKLLATLWQ